LKRLCLLLSGRYSLWLSSLGLAYADGHAVLLCMVCLPSSWRRIPTERCSLHGGELQARARALSYLRLSEWLPKPPAAGKCFEWACLTDMPVEAPASLANDLGTDAALAASAWTEVRCCLVDPKHRHGLTVVMRVWTCCCWMQSSCSIEGQCWPAFPHPRLQQTISVYCSQHDSSTSPWRRRCAVSGPHDVEVCVFWCDEMLGHQFPSTPTAGRCCQWLGG